MRRKYFDWAGNLAAFALVVAVNVMSNVMPINGQSMPEISAKYPSLFTPAGFAFSIWGVIYLALLGFVVYQALPSQRHNDRLARISVPFKINCIANASWLFAWHYDLLLLSVVIMFVILVTLVAIYRSLIADIEDSTPLQHLTMHLPFSLYTGWITLATIVNLSVVQTAYGWDDVGIDAVNWTLFKLGIAGAIGVTVALRLHDVVFVAVVAWAAYGISVKQAATPAVAGSATTIALLALMLVIREGAVRLRRFRE